MARVNRSRRWRVATKAMLAAMIGLLASSSSEALRMCKTQRGDVKIRETCGRKQTDQGEFPPPPVGTPELDARLAAAEEQLAVLGGHIGSLGEELGDVRGVGTLRFWHLDGQPRIASGGLRTVLHTAELPAGKWLIGAKIDVVNNNKFPVSVIDSYYRCQLWIDENPMDQSTVLMHDFDLEVQTLTLFTFVDWHEAVTLRLSCGADTALEPVLAEPYVEAGRVWAISAASVAGL